MSHDALGVTVSTDVCTSSSWTHLLILCSPPHCGSTSSSWTRHTLNEQGNNGLCTDGIRRRRRVGSTHRPARPFFPSGSSRSLSTSTRQSSTRQSILQLGNGWLRSGKNRRGRLNNLDKRRLLCGRSRDRRGVRRRGLLDLRTRLRHRRPLHRSRPVSCLTG
jgi:hypothetical protein